MPADQSSDTTPVPARTESLAGAGLVSGAAAAFVGAPLAFLIAPFVLCFGTLLAALPYPNPASGELIEGLTWAFIFLGPAAGMVAAVLGGIAAFGIGAVVGFLDIRAMDRNPTPGGTANRSVTNGAGTYAGTIAGLVIGPLTGLGVGSAVPGWLLLVWYVEYWL